MKCLQFQVSISLTGVDKIHASVCFIVAAVKLPYDATVLSIYTYSGETGRRGATARLALRPRPDPSFKSLYVHISFIVDWELFSALEAPECTFIEDDIA